MQNTIVKNRLLECEEVIERGLNTFVEVGAALLEIRDSRLYKDNYSTFEDYCRERWGMSRIHAHRLIESAGVVENLLPMGNILPTSERQARPLVGLPPELQAQIWQEALETSPNGKITASHVQDVVDKITKPHVAHNSGENEWYTPQEYINAARRVMNAIDLDPASSEIANRTVGAKKFYNTESNGLTKRWTGRVWMNPPYSGDLIGKFVEKYVKHIKDGDISEGIVLVNNATETNWFRKLVSVSKAIVFTNGRIKFIDPSGKPSGAPLQGQAILYAGDYLDSFIQEFSEFGWAVIIC